MFDDTPLNAPALTAAVRGWQSVTIHKNPKQGIPAGVAARQRDLVEHVVAGGELLADYMIDQLRTRLDDDNKARYDLNAISAAAPSLTTPATPQEIEHTPMRRETAWYDDLGRARLPRAHAAEPWFWVLAHAKWIADGSFGEPRQQMEAWCKNADTDDKCVRNFFRRVCGLPVVIGGASVLTDTRVVRAWWRVDTAHLVQQELSCYPSLCGDEPPSFERVHALLNHNATWAELARRAVQAVTVLGEPKAVAALVAALFNAGHSPNHPPPKEVVTASAFALGRFARTRNIHFTPMPELVRVASQPLA